MRKLRLAELAFGLNNKWARGARIDFFDSLYVFSLMGDEILNMRFKANNGKSLPLTFSWSRLDKQWQLVTLESSEDIPGSSDDEQKDCTYRPPKDFGKISLEQIDPEKILKPNAQGMCK